MFSEIIWWFIAAFLAFFIKGLCGFANTLVFDTVLSFTANNINISPVELVLGYPSNVILAVRERKNIRWKVCLPMIGFMIIGAIPGAFFLKNSDSTTVKIILGIIISLLGAEMLFKEFKEIPIKDGKIFRFVIGLASGILCGIYGVGALVGAYISRISANTHEVKANVAMIFWIENTYRIILYVIYGIITLDILKRAIILLPAMLLGLLSGILFSNVLDEKIAKRLVIIILIFSGIGLIIAQLG